MEQKYHSGSKSKPRCSSGGFGTVVFVILSIALIAGIIVLSPLGNYLMEHVISPIFSSSGKTVDDKSIVSALKQQEEQRAPETTSPKPSEKAHEVIVMEEVPFYILQMGTFTNEDAAAQHADEIRRMGAGGAVYKDGSLYRVFAAAYLDESSLVKVQSQVRSDGFEATPYITESKAIRITLDGDQKAVDTVSEASKILNSIPSELCSLCLSFDKSDISRSDLIEKLQKCMESCVSTIKSMEQINTNDIVSMKELFEKYVKSISTFLNRHDTMNTEMVSGELKHLQLSVIIDYILFYNQE